MPYQYYDTPDGEDCFKKLWITTKFATKLGLSLSIADVLLYSHTKGYIQTAGRCIYITAPLIGMAATFTVTTCLLTNLRKEDDHINYFLGGAAVGSVFGAVKKSGYQGLVAALLIGAASVVLKSHVMYGWDITKLRYERAYGGVDHYIADWTLTKDRPRDWKKSLDEETSN